MWPLRKDDSCAAAREDRWTLWTAAALIAYLTVVCRLPRRVVEALLGQVLGIEISLGSTQKCWEEASQAVAAPCQELEQRLKDESVLNVDETGWRTNGEKRYL